MSAAARSGELRSVLAALATFDLPPAAHALRREAEGIAFALDTDVMQMEADRAREVALLTERIAELESALRPSRREIDEQIEERAVGADFEAERFAVEADQVQANDDVGENDE